MDANAFRYLYDYHFSEFRNMWDSYITPLTQSQFTQEVAYSHGSVRNQVLHLINAERMWLCELENLDYPGDLKHDELDDRELIRREWDKLERDKRAYLARLTDEMLFSRPITFEEDKDLIVWQVLLHVVNHGTDHRAQLLRVLHDLGAKTVSQDFIFYVYDHKSV